MRQQYAWRSNVLAGILAFIAFAIIVQMIRIQNSAEAAIFRQLASNYAVEQKTFYPDRGEIYDRNGHLLAGNKTVYEVGVDLFRVKDPHAIAMTLSVELGVDYAETLAMIQNPADGIAYVVVKDFVEADKAAYLQQLKVTMQEQAPAGDQADDRQGFQQRNRLVA